MTKQHTREGEGTATAVVQRERSREAHRHEQLSRSLEQALINPGLSREEWGALLTDVAAQLDAARGSLQHGVLRSWVSEAKTRARGQWWKLFAVPAASVSVERFGLLAVLAKSATRAADVPEVLERRLDRLNSLLAEDAAMTPPKGRAPIGQGTVDPPVRGVGAMYSARSIAERFGVDLDALEKRLKRWRRGAAAGDYLENGERKGHEPRYVYCVDKLPGHVINGRG